MLGPSDGLAGLVMARAREDAPLLLEWRWRLCSVLRGRRVLVLLVIFCPLMADAITGALNRGLPARTVWSPYWKPWQGAGIQVCLSPCRLCRNSLPPRRFRQRGKPVILAGPSLAGMLALSAFPRVWSPQARPPGQILAGCSVSSETIPSPPCSG